MNTLVCALVFTVIATACAGTISLDELTSYNYHMKVGIPLAATIKINEDNGSKTELLNQKIIGGTITDISAVPYQVSLKNASLLY
jgi:hypothetical protein